MDRWVTGGEQGIEHLPNCAAATAQLGGIGTWWRN